MSTFDVISIKSASSVNSSTIYCLAKKKLKAKTQMQMIEKTAMILKNLIAWGTSLAPIQFPMRPQLASWMPWATISSVTSRWKNIVYDASSLTPKIPAMIVRASKAQNSEQIIAAEGRLVLR